MRMTAAAAGRKNGLCRTLTLGVQNVGGCCSERRGRGRTGGGSRGRTEGDDPRFLRAITTRCLRCSWMAASLACSYCFASASHVFSSSDLKSSLFVSAGANHIIYAYELLMVAHTYTHIHADDPCLSIRLVVSSALKPDNKRLSARIFGCRFCCSQCGKSRSDTR